MAPDRRSPDADDTRRAGASAGRTPDASDAGPPGASGPAGDDPTTVPFRVRSATPADAAGLLAIYEPIVRGTHVSFEEEPPDVAEMARRVEAKGDVYPWLVAEHADGSIVGYAYGGSFRGRRAYRWSVEVSAYVREDARGRGVGRALYGALLDELRRRGFVTAVAGIALPNPGSVAFHEAFGFEPVGTFRAVGYKLGRWWDVGWWQRALREPPERPREI